MVDCVMFFFFLSKSQSYLTESDDVLNNEAPRRFAIDLQTHSLYLLGNSDSASDFHSLVVREKYSQNMLSARVDVSINYRSV